MGTHENCDGKPTRREFIRETGLAAASVAVGAITARRAYGANDRIGVGVIGCGGRGTHHLGVLERLKTNGVNVDTVAVCDTYRPRLQRAADKYKAKAYMDHRELLADPNVDLVCIATPDHHHGYAAIDAVRAGKDVYCEKPVTHWRQFELTKKLCGEVQKSGRVFQLGSQGMSDNAWRQARKLIEDGAIGKPIHAECGYFRVGDWGERGMPIDDPNVQPGPDLDWAAFLGDSPKRPFEVSRYFRWRMYEDYAGGPCTDLFPHSLTPVVYMLSVTMPSTVVATGGKFRYEEREVPDTFNMLIDYPENITIALLGTQGNAYPGTGFRGAGGRVPVIRGWERTLTLQGDNIAVMAEGGSDKPEKLIPIEYGENIDNHWQNLFSCCRTREKTHSPMDLAFHVQTALQMGYLSWRDGKTARFNSTKQKIRL
ncbi:MAG: Gfo/Idh/MocA family oxidoreductase [Candidatus Hydrogenedentes bacterium]|nr:Gfo/Idh/MocA family oxidoreductase [Candidatus Hydrogenedentota bacterium]